MVARESTQVIGMELPLQTAVAFKQEAAGRNVRLNELFEEMGSFTGRQSGKIRQRKTSDGSQQG